MSFLTHFVSLSLVAIMTFKHHMALYMVNESVVIKSMPLTVELSRVVCGNY